MESVVALPAYGQFHEDCATRWTPPETATPMRAKSKIDEDNFIISEFIFI
jgi:hypothetical protein